MLYNAAFSKIHKLAMILQQYTERLAESKFG